MRRAGQWLAGTALAVAGNGGLAVVLLAAIAPDPAPEPPRPDTVFDIGSHDVPQSRAEEQVPDSDAVAADETSGVRAGGAAIPSSRAAPAEMPGQRLAAAPALGQTVQSVADAGAAVPVEGAGGAPVASEVPTGAAVAAAPAEAEALAGLAAGGAVVLDAPPPVSAPVPDLALPTASAAATAPEAGRLEVASMAADRVDARAPEDAEIAAAAAPAAEAVPSAAPAGVALPEVSALGTAAAVSAPAAEAVPSAAPAGAALPEVAAFGTAAAVAVPAAEAAVSAAPVGAALPEVAAAGPALTAVATPGDTAAPAALSPDRLAAASVPATSAPAVRETFQTENLAALAPEGAAMGAVSAPSVAVPPSDTPLAEAGPSVPLPQDTASAFALAPDRVADVAPDGEVLTDAVPASVVAPSAAVVPTRLAGAAPLPQPVAASAEGAGVTLAAAVARADAVAATVAPSALVSAVSAAPQTVIADARPEAAVPAEVVLAGLGASVSVAALPTAPAAVAAPSAETVTAAPSAAGPALSPAPPRAPQVSAAPGTGIVVDPGVAGDFATVAPDLPPEVERQTAALAWSGNGAADLNPVSLAAIQSFAQAGDPPPGAPRVRDRIGGLLASVPCARLQTVFDPDSGVLRLRGHLPEDGVRAPVLAALADEVGGAIPLEDAALVLPRPVCGVLAQLDSVGLAQSDEQDADPRIVGQQPFAAVKRFVAGEQLEFSLEGPDYPAYFYVDYFDADGQVLHLQPNELVPAQQIGANVTQRVGLGPDGQPAIEITVVPPFGREVLAAFAASEPLYYELRPIVEPAAPYLAFLAEAVAAAKARSPAFRGEWFYFISETAAE